MKTTIKTSALILGLALLSTGVFAANKPIEGPVSTEQNLVLFTSLPSEVGVQVIVHKATPTESAVKIYDADDNLIMSDHLSKKDAVSRKGYELSQLADGNYTFAVSSNKTVTKRLVHVYHDENNQKAFFFEM